MVDEIIEKSDLSTNGAYTAVGTYDFGEMVQLLTNLSESTKIEPKVLLHTFGLHLMDVFISSYASFFQNKPTVYQFLESIDNHIHIEVKKLYPDAELPKFTHEYEGNDLRLFYSSKRNLSDLAHGLIEGCIKYYNESLKLTIIPRAFENGDPYTEFRLSPGGAV
jgi:hypothetical protein